MDQAPASNTPAFLRPATLGLVFSGAALGALAREGLVLIVPAVGGVPLAILFVNVVGALLLGWLYAVVDRRALAHAARGAHRDAARRRALRLFLGTGALGGFTTYSALAGGTVTLLLGGAPWLGVGYALGTLLLGALAAWAGMLLGGERRRA